MHLRNLIAYVSTILSTSNKTLVFDLLCELDFELAQRIEQGWIRRKHLSWLGFFGFEVYLGQWRNDALDEL